ncbi:MAG: PolC-type DNA polymerase III [Bacilli bacterium]|nr:PolC-type DNA polymerase III [Bacilli bacterium]
MQDKLKLLLEKIKLEQEYYSFFNGAKIEKLVINDKKKEWIFIINIKDTLPVTIYNHINDLMRQEFNNLNYININYQVENINYEFLNEYYINIINQSNIKSLNNFVDRYIKTNDHIILEVLNKIEYDKLGKYKEKIENGLKQAGFDKELKIIINEEKREKVKNEIKEETVIKVNKKQVKNNPIIYGNEIKARKIMAINDIISELDNVVIEGYIFGLNFFESNKNNYKIITIKISDNTDSIFAKIFTQNQDEYNRLSNDLKEGNWYRFRGYVKNDRYARDLVINLRDVMVIESKDDKRIDEAEVKRVELHTHTYMSQMDGVVSVNDLIKRAKDYGHQAIAITDHNSCQAFPEAYYNAKDIKVIYGVEVGMIDDSIDIVLRGSEEDINDSTYVVFDFETTGFNATSGDSIIEVGAVKLHNGKIIDQFQALINPGVTLNETITNITGITDDMLKDKDSEDIVINKFKEWIGDLPLVAHNAKFDVSFLENAYYKYNLGELTNPIIDTLELSRALDSSYGRHSLSHIVKRYEVEFDENSHHRAIYDAEKTALVFAKMIDKLTSRNIEKINKINDLVAKDEIHKFGNIYHITLLAKNNIGLKNMFKIVSLMNTKYLSKTPRILRSEIINHREGILIGSSCYNGEVFTLARSKTDDEMSNIMQFYDYIEVQPLNIYSPLIQRKDFANDEELKEHVKKIIRIAKNNNKLVVATGDVHHLDEKDKIYREIFINQKVPGGGRHPLNRENIKNIPSQHFLTTNEMLNAFSFLDQDLAYEMVVTNSNKIADMIDKVQIIKDKLYTPKMADSDKIVTDMVYTKAKLVYGDELPEIVQKRIDEELNSIISNGFDVIYLIAQKLVKKSNDDGYIVGSRGSVGSSFAATMMGITEVNPLPPHYVCLKCKKSIFEVDGVSLGSNYSSGYDLPDKVCTCGTKMQKEGQDMPFATFLGFKGDKVPDIDLNFSGEYQAKAHNYTKQLFGEGNVYRAGTIGTVASKTAFGFVKGYMEDKHKSLRMAEQDRLAIGCTGVKRTTGQHPGGIIVIPDYMDIFDFTPYQYPADDINASWYTTHFDFHAIHDNVLKLDILGHDDPTALKMLQDLTKIDILTIPFDDKKVLSLFSKPDVLNVTKEQIMCETGTLGVPEFGTRFVIDMLNDTKPNTFAELVKISGLSHGTDVWLGNAQDLIRHDICAFKDVIGCRDDIMTYLMYHGLEPIDAFNIMEFVRKGKPSKDPKKW